MDNRDKSRSEMRYKIMIILYQISLYEKNNIPYDVSNVIEEQMETETDQAILRMAVYEILYTDTPNVVCIDEAIELAKKYSDEKVCKMINGILDKIYHEHK